VKLSDLAPKGATPKEIKAIAHAVLKLEEKVGFEHYHACSLPEQVGCLYPGADCEKAKCKHYTEGCAACALLAEARKEVEG
jgi:hypothetical protein